MTTADEALPIGGEAIGPARSRLARGWSRCEQLLERVGERLNPILIKEARQALKSRQFTITFALVLGAAWVWSILGLAWAGPSVYYGAEGPDLLLIYYFILAFPLLVVVPYGAFRSLAGELEDRTYELLSITTLKARQIIGGKLSTSLLQMLVYLSAISPCIAFTYLLRGVDIVTILLLVFYTCLASLGFSLAGLLLATCAQDKYRQVVASVLLVLVLGGVFLSACEIGSAMISAPPFSELKDFLLVNSALLSAYGSYFVLLYLAAAAQLSFAGSNRSTALRIVMVGQQVLFCGWMGYAWVESERRIEVALPLLLVSGIHWFVMGMFLTGEPDHLSPRVQRDLPQSFLGRALFTWFNPGPGTGYLFVLANCLTIWLLALMLLPFRGVAAGGLPGFFLFEEKVFDFGLIGLSYLAIYLGLGKLLLNFARRATHVGVVLRVLVNVVLVAVGTAVPLAIQFSSEALRTMNYNLLQITNPFWTLAEVGAFGRGLPAEIDLLRIALGTAAALVVLLNLPGVVAEVRQVRMAKPARVAADDAALAPAAQPLRTSPWDVH